MKQFKGKIDSITFVLSIARSMWLISRWFLPASPEGRTWTYSVPPRVIWDVMATPRAPESIGDAFC